MHQALLIRLAFIGLTFFISAKANCTQTLFFSGNTMGTTYHVTLVTDELSLSQQVIQVEIDRALRDINAQMSTYQYRSVLSQFNRLPAGVKLPVSADMAKVIQASIALFYETDGALDITLGPLVNLWGFGPDRRPIKIPSLTLITQTKFKTGVAHLHLEQNQLSKDLTDIYVDLSAIAKGFGVDKVAELLMQYQPKGYLVEIGGEVRTYGVKADDSVWRVAIEKPDVEKRSIQQVIKLENMAMATSGDYRHYYEEEHQRFTHIVDPRNGYPVSHPLASVTVLHPQTMIADGYATAMMVLGTEASLVLAQKQQLPIMLIEKDGEGFKIYYSEAFLPFIQDKILNNVFNPN